MSIRLNILAFVLGVGLLQQQAVLLDMVWIGFLLPFALAVWLWRPDQTAIWVAARRVLLFLFCFIAGFFWATVFAHWRLADLLPYEWEGRDIQLIGVVASLPHYSDRHVRFRLDVEQILTPNASVPRHISLAWYKMPGQLVSESETGMPKIRAGERWLITTRLKRPHSNANPHGFDFEVWALERNIGASGYVRKSNNNVRMDQMVNHPAYWIERMRQDMRDRFMQILSGKDYAGVLVTLATGDKDAITRDQWQIFTRTGTNHLMAISGLHITMVSSLVFILTYWCWRRISYLVLCLPARKAAIMAGLVAALGYALLSGFAIPAQRAFCMLAVVAAALWSGWHIVATSVLAWTLLWVVMFDPWAVCSPGFWLSFGAIAIIMLVTVGRVGSMHWLSGWMRVQWAITLGLIPILLGMFQQVSLVSPIANAIAIPLVSLAIVPLTLLATVPLLDFLLLPAHFVLSGGMELLQALSETSQGIWQQHAPPKWTLIVGMIGVVWILLPGSLGVSFLSGFPARWLGLLALLPMFLVPPSRPAAGELWLTVLDVGQGLAVVARTAQHTLLFDTGPGFGDVDSGSRIIVPFLRGEGIKQLDALIVSHADSDHSGGAMSVLNAMPVSWLISPLPLDHPIQQAAANKRQCHADLSWQWDGVLFELLHPAVKDYPIARRSTNAFSCVLKITSDHGSVLLPADIGRQAEQALLMRANDALLSTVLIAPHHGSMTSSSEAFVRYVNPEYTIFTVGYRNRFDHPRKEVVERYRTQGSSLLRSDKDGAVLLYFADNKVVVETWRSIYRRYWQRAIEPGAIS